MIYIWPTLIQISFIIGGMILIWCIKLIYSKMVSSTTPSGKQLEEFVKKAKHLKASGISYQDRLKYLRKQGLLKKVAEQIIISADQE
jgi:hypothetical protein